MGFLQGLSGWPWDTSRLLSQGCKAEALWFSIFPLGGSSFLSLCPTAVLGRDPGPLRPGFGMRDPGALPGTSQSCHHPGREKPEAAESWKWLQKEGEQIRVPVLRGAACRFLGFLLWFQWQGAAGSSRPHSCRTLTARDWHPGWNVGHSRVPRGWDSRGCVLQIPVTPGLWCFRVPVALGGPRV